jgi:hypothetical protein
LKSIFLRSFATFKPASGELELAVRLKWGVGVGGAAAVDAVEGDAVGDDGEDGWIGAGEDEVAGEGNTS